VKDWFIANCNLIAIHDFCCGVFWRARIWKSLDGWWWRLTCSSLRRHTTKHISSIRS